MLRVCHCLSLVGSVDGRNLGMVDLYKLSLRLDNNMEGDKKSQPNMQ